MPQQAFIDEHFYYSQKGKDSFRAFPPGEPIINLMIEGKPHWRQDDGIKRLRKTLIIADWTMEKWLSFKKRQVLKTIKHLLKIEFTIYIWDENRLKQLTPETLDLIDDNPHLSYFVPNIEHIEKTAVDQLNITKDEVQVIDYHWIDSLLDPDLYPLNRPREFKLSYPLAVLEDKTSCEELRRSVQQIVYDKFSPNQAQVEKLQEVFPHLKSIERYQQLSILADKQQFIFNQQNLVLRTKDYSTVWQYKDRHEISYLYINILNLLSPENIFIFSLLNHFPNLKKLFILSGKINTEKSDLIKYPYQMLEDLTLSEHVDAEPHDVSNILRLTPNLKKLNLLTDVRSSDTDDNTPFLLPHLTCLQSVYSFTSESYINKILSVSSHIQDCEFHIITNSPFNLSEQQLPYLRKITLHSEPGCRINVAYDSLLNASSDGSLQHIELFGEIDKPIHGVNKLKNVKKFKATHIKSPILITHLKHMPKLQSLSLTFKSEDQIKPFPALVHLLNLTISGTMFSMEELGKILECTPHIKKLTLQKTFKKIGDDYFSIKALQSLQSLEVLDLSHTEFSASLIKNLLRGMPNLKEFHVLGVKKSGILNMQKYMYTLVSSVYNKNFPQKTDLPKIIHDYDKKVQGKSQSVNPSIPCDVKHQPEVMRDFIPNTTFEFKNQNKTLNQKMIIEKLSQYLIVTQTHLACIPKLQNGICKPLSHLFLDMKRNNKTRQEQWLDFVKPIQRWNGQIEALTPECKMALDIIFKKVQTHQFIETNEKMVYIGDQLQALLNDRKSYLLTNPLHMIALLPEEDEGDAWIMFDPNFVGGPKRVGNSNLLQLITDQIGNLVSVALSPEEFFSCDSIPVISDINAFIKQGGILALIESDNQKAMFDILLKKAKELKLESLEGLLLRNNLGLPAWARALNNSFCKDYVLNLISYWIAHDKNAIKLLQNSISHLDPSIKKEILNLLTHFTHKNTQTKSYVKEEKHNLLEEDKAELKDGMASSAVMHTLIQTISQSSNIEYYKKQLETWKKEIHAEVDDKTFAHQMLAAEGSHLIECSSKDTSNTLPYILHRHAHSLSKPIFHIYSPNDLVCSTQWIKRDKKNTNIGSVEEPPGGRLHNFLKENHAKNPILIVHYDNFTTEDIVRFNAIIDKKPSADGTSLPKGTKVIGIMNIKRNDAYQGDDFYSRFTTVESCPLTHHQVLQAAPLLPFEKKMEEKPSSIDLYASNDWKSRLLGTWKLHGDQLVFAGGLLAPLLKQLSDNKSNLLEIRNGLWSDPEFQHFWHQALLDGFVNIAGLQIDIPANLRLIKSQGYEWKNKLKRVQIKQSLLYDKKTRTLNPTTFHLFFEQYQCDNNKKSLHTKPGWIEQQNGKTLHINLTRSLSESQWAKLLDQCEKYHVTLKIHASNNIIYPSDFTLPSKEEKLPQPPAFVHTRSVVAADLDAAVMSVKNDEKKWKVIDISECSPADLLMRLDGSWNKKDKRFYFTETKQALLTLLEKGERIILKGHFSDELADALTSFLLERVSEKKQTGQLVLLTSQPHLFHVIACEHLKPLTPDDKKNYLIKKGYGEVKKIDAALFEKASCSELEAHLISDDPWIGMQTLAPFEDDKASCDFENSKTIADAFTKQRIQLLSDMLSIAPYAFITGLTGIGKTTFMQREYKKYLKKRGGKLYQNESNITAWAEDQGKGEKILFIDEANLSSRQWSEFEGLFENPPGILINGTYYPLTKEHKVVFAGNPVSYGDERTLAPLFKRHGNAVLFKPLPLEFIYDSILNPLFIDSDMDEKNKQAICNEFFQIYQTVLSFSKNEILMSPRELQTMALLTIDHAKLYPHEALHAAKYYAYFLAKSVVPLDKLSQLKQPNVMLTKDEKKEEKSDFLITPSRTDTCRILDDLFKLRTLRLKKFRELRLAKKKMGIWQDFLYGGLGGLVLEGVPAAGKSDMVISQLEAAGFKEGEFSAKENEEKKEYLTPDDIDPLKLKDNIFYKMPVSMSITEKEALLCKAFNEGAIVVVDEINSSTMMERVLNEMLMGKYKGKRPIRPGFMIIGTQNPANMAGRRKASNALSRRMMTITLPPYSTEEIKAILVHKGVSETRAQELAEAFHIQAKKAEVEHLKPAPTLRKLIDIAEGVIGSEQHFQKTLSENRVLIDKFQDKNSLLIQFYKRSSELKARPESKEWEMVSEMYEQLTHLGSSDKEPVIQLHDKLLTVMGKSPFSPTLFKPSFSEKTTLLFDQLERFLQESIFLKNKGLH